LLRFHVSTYDLYYTDDSHNRKRRAKKNFMIPWSRPLPARLDPDNEPKRLNIVAPASWVRRIDDWRRKQADLPNLSEAIRRLVEAGLDAERKGKRR
jgi:hypothetical protein